MGDSIFEFGEQFQINSPWEKSNAQFQVAGTSNVTVSGYWSSDANGKNKITEAPLYDTVYFHLTVAGALKSKGISLKLYEEDSFSSTSLGYTESKTLSTNGKTSFSLKIKKEWKKHLDEDAGSYMEIYWQVVIDGVTHSLTGSGLNVYEDEYFSAIHEDKYRYTCNCGWIDKTHAFTDTKRKQLGIGVQSLWNQILNETGTKSAWKNGFKVVYTQDAKVGPFYPGVTKAYFVKSGLSIKVKEQVALAIFQEVSIEFEAYQAMGTIIGKGSSSFEPADLISNLINFYRVLRPELSKDTIMSKCKELDLQKSVSVYKKYPGTFSSAKYKNEKFTPRYFTNDHCSSESFPKELQEIKPYKKDDDAFRDWIDLFDIHKGIPPITGPKY